jgi:hypothetical protein
MPQKTEDSTGAQTNRKMYRKGIKSATSFSIREGKGEHRTTKFKNFRASSGSHEWKNRRLLTMMAVPQSSTGFSWSDPGAIRGLLLLDEKLLV